LFNSNPANPRQAQLTVRQLPPPDDFNRDARDLWSAAQRQLRLQGTWERTDRPLLEMYVRNLQAARYARERADELKHSSHIEQRAAVKQAQDAEAAAFALAKVLLLTPEARKRHGINGPPAGAGSELDALLG
jgi:phage terminase small subunit